jgi:hypothetical protein
MVENFETFKGGERDADGYLILHDNPFCVRCKKPIALHAIKDINKHRIIQILGYCQRCFLEIMGW